MTDISSALAFVAQLATRVVNALPTAFIECEKCLGLFTRRLVAVSCQQRSDHASER